MPLPVAAAAAAGGGGGAWMGGAAAAGAAAAGATKVVFYEYLPILSSASLAAVLGKIAWKRMPDWIRDDVAFQRPKTTIMDASDDATSSSASSSNSSRWKWTGRKTPTMLSKSADSQMKDIVREVNDDELEGLSSVLEKMQAWLTATSCLWRRSRRMIRRTRLVIHP